MAPLPEENTARVWVDYFNGHDNHSIMARYNDETSSSAECLAYVGQFLAALDPILYEITILGARAANQGSTVSFAVTWPGDSTYGTGAMPLVVRPRELRFVGRSGTGRRVSFSVYGFNGTTPDTFRLARGDDPAIADAIDAIAAAVADDAMRTIDLSNQQMKQYANVNFNSHWEYVARG